ncbi:MAG TPA: hypothetical protein VJU86_02115 [Pyrinomonadaceae bacterium]|nr:hypothetical protein [Pyrinomonadaceae bacterium]
MAKQTLLWTALPNGYNNTGRFLRVSLLLSPRLEPDAGGDLSTFPDFIDWPATIRQTRFVINFGKAPLGTSLNSVTIAGDQITGRNKVDNRLALPESDVWKALFPGFTRVHGYTFRDLTKHEVLSYPADDMDKMVRKLYTKMAASATDQLPTASTFIADQEWSDLLNNLQENDIHYSDRETGIRLVAKQFDDFRKGLLSGDTTAAKLARFQLFHTPPSTSKRDRYREPDGIERENMEWVGYEQTKLPSPAKLEEEIDFHKIVTAVGQYPTLLRKLGLAIDFLIARDEFTPRPDGLLWAEVQLPNAEPAPDISPRTFALLEDRRFQAVPKTPAADFRVVDGLLELDPKKFSLLQADVDGSGHKVMNFARSLIDMRQFADHQVDPVTKQKRELGAPALRNAGLMLVHKQRANMLKNAIAKQAGFQKAATDIQLGADPATTSPKMHAEDLVRGYRIDIWDDVTKKWRSLCQREAIYNIDDGAFEIKVPTEEGVVKLAATTSPDPKSNPDIIWLHETLVSWAGWSLCVAPPGKTIHHQAGAKDKDGKDVVVHDDPVGESEVEVPPGIRLKSEFKIVKNSLPRLRYGRSYWLRARAVDLAGNSLDYQLKDFGPEKPEDNDQPYYRYEPISAPAIALVKPTPSTTKRPAEGESMERMAIRSFNDNPTLNTVAAVERTQRFAVPSRTTQREAEHHGMLDRGGIVDPTFFATLVAQDNSLAEEMIQSAGPLPTSPPVETAYSVMVEGEKLPYLPEPLAVEVGARILNHPNFPVNKVIPIPFYADTDWPEALPFKIEIYENPADLPRFDEGLRTLFIPLPKATRATLRLSVKPNQDAMKVLGIWNWLSPAEQNKVEVINGEPFTLERLAREGQHWMLTPWRNVELVHAVQRPLLNPDISEMFISRNKMKTFAVPRFFTSCHIASTDRLDLRATWNEPHEEALGKPLKNIERVDHAYSIKITDSNSYAGLSEYRDRALNEIEIGSARVSIPKVHEFHDTRYRRIEYWLEATTKFREFFPPSVLTETVKGEPKPTEKNIKVVGAPIRRWIESSAPPPAPDVLYVMPTFGWVRSGDETTRKSWRRGGGLRVYLNRPWHASGYGEMLAVVLPGARFPGDPNDWPVDQPLKNFVTQWGNDPIWFSPSVEGVAPKARNFPLARTQADPDGKWLPALVPAKEADQPPGPFRTIALPHPELRNPTGDFLVDIAPHDVFYDNERQLWYCDIEVDWGASYFPFIRLALARYQPVALESAHLSNIVIADFMPLIPDRWLNVNHTRDPRTRRLRVFGHTYSSSSGNKESGDNPGSINVASSSVIKVWVERLDPTLGEDFGWSREPRAIIHNDEDQLPIRPELIPGLRATNLVRHREFEALLDENLIDHVFISPTLWQGTVTLPEVADDVRLRLVIAEYEEYLIDDDKPYDYPVREKGQRLVFVEHVELG